MRQEPEALPASDRELHVASNRGGRRQCLKGSLLLRRAVVQTQILHVYGRIGTASEVQLKRINLPLLVGRNPFYGLVPALALAQVNRKVGKFVLYPDHACRPTAAHGPEFEHPAWLTEQRSVKFHRLLCLGL